MVNIKNLISPRWLKVIRDITTNRARAILVIASITVGIFAVGVVQHINTVVIGEMNAVYEQSNAAHASITTSGVDDELLEVIREMSGVADAEGRGSMTVDVQISGNLWEPMTIQAISSFEEQRVGIVQLDAQPDAALPATETYRWPAEEQLVLERSSLDMQDRLPEELTVGDSLTIEGNNGKTRTLELTGLAYDANGLPVPFTGTPMGYVDMDTFEWLGGEATYSEINIRVEGGPMTEAYAQQILDEVVVQIEDAGLVVQNSRAFEPGELPLQSIFDALALILTPLGILALILGSFLVVNTMSALIAQQTRQIGVMKSIGATRSDLIRMYLGAVVIYSLISMLIAIGLTVIVAGLIEAVLGGFINVTMPGWVLPANVLWVEVAIGLLVPSLAALWPILQGTSITVREAISDYGVGSGPIGKSWIERLIGSIKGISQPLQISLRNTFRKKGRLVLTLITLTLGGMIFMTVGSVQSSLEGQVDQVLAYNQFDIQITLDREYRVAQVEQAAFEVQNVATVETWDGGSAIRVREDGTESDTISITALPPSSEMVDPTMESGRWLLDADENAVVLSQSILDTEPDIQVGDEIVLEIDEKERPWVVVGFAQTTDFTGGISAYVNQTYFGRITNNVSGAQTVLLKMDPVNTTSLADMAVIIEEHLEDSNIGVSGIQTVEFIRSFTGSFFSIIITLLLVMGVLIATVGALGLAGTMSTNVLERTREIGVMRAIGAADGTILAVVLVEGIIIGLISWLIGAGLAWPVGLALSSAIGVVLFQAPLGYVFSATGVFSWLLIVAILAGIASLIPARNASRVTVREALAYE